MEIATKILPDHYPQDVLAVLRGMSLTDLKGLRLVGSMSIRSQLYAGDYDAWESVEASSVQEAVDGFRGAIQELRSMKDVRIGDIKSGEIDEWRILSPKAMVENGRITGFSAVESARVVDSLPLSVMNKNEKKEAIRMLNGVKDPVDLVRLKKTGYFKVHIVRWTPGEVLAGQKTLADGRVYTLEEAFQSPALTKLDVIALVQGRLTEFSCIYQFFVKGKLINPIDLDPIGSLREDVLYYASENNPFKALKRRFAIAKLEGDNETAARLTPILNSDLGRLYVLVGDIGTMITLLESKNPPVDEIRREIDAFRARLANVYKLEAYLKRDSEMIGEINSILKLPTSQVRNRLEKVKTKLEDILAKGMQSVPEVV
jgi:hypothetical protein